MTEARQNSPRQRTILIQTRDGEGGMATLDFGDPKRPVDIVFVHANGFNARTYRTILQPLAKDMRILAPDLRGHGRTRLPLRARGRRDWRDLRDDIAALLEALDGPPVTLAGHSMGGTVCLLAAAKAAGRVRNLALFDPVMLGPVGVVMAHMPFATAMAARRAPIAVAAARRRAVFDSRAAAFKAYKGRGAFKTWPDSILRDYVADGFIDQLDGTIALACPPGWEAVNYTTHAHDPYAALRKFAGRVRIVRGTRGSTCRVKDIAGFERRYPGATIEKIDGGHFFPMEKPEVVRAALKALADAPSTQTLPVSGGLA